ncbi:phosphate acetyltransferase [Flavobacterium johnsoniae]|jgi:phosphate acetyltransferase|uniref:Phosphate acetyltransferase n=2 Tax=Flavobacterium johnsoniae TaxID=986 RepID=A0A1M5M4L0_FLAJO|nr:phosphate acetyltransferase [Flavobacterium johnsoniae]ABQ06543.1 phosphate acetyltransferase [Flavobacterium johnsoniae UW101]OXE99781.1 phosphate acetyltransferase [Flavobacterium johnsoniae UW101]WQG82295.1 phosphate acetyltransferase [Flavobacterium johnsoniae UW101]SHG72237.1 phosphate acetyltransferase [Flavobacterium johnsoniae]SHK78935.1 phosphate acetyltransferase [Flavobacterium johnsoniae]
MSKAIYIATSDYNSGKSIITLGLMSILIGKTAKVGYFRPIIEDFVDGEVDNHIETVLSYFNLDIDFEDAYAITKSKLIKKKNKGKIGEVLDLIIEKYKKLEERFDFVLVEGTSFTGEGTSIELDLNVLIAKNLGIPTIIVGSGVGKTLEELLDSLYLVYDSFKVKEVEVLSVFANKVQPENIELVTKSLQKTLPSNVLINTIPLISSLNNPTMQEIVNELNAKVLFGENYLNNEIGHYSVGAMQLHNYLVHLHDNALVITPGDRSDIILGALQANESANYPTISGIILTGNIVPEESILKLIEGLSAIVPIIAVDGGTYHITNKIGSIKSEIYANNTHKIETSITTFEKYVNNDALSERLITFQAEGMTPKMFQYNMVKRAKQHRKHIVLPEGNDDRIITAASRLLDMDVVDISIIGDKKQIENKVVELGITLDFSKVNIINPIESEMYEDYANTYYELRKAKNVSITMARDLMEDVSYFGTMMVYKGHADGMVSGAAHTTQHTILPALQFIKTKPNSSVVSSVFFMCLEDRVSVFGDCAINPNPTAEQLAEIAISSAESSLAFGIEPKIAMLSYSSGSSGKGDEVDKVRTATAIVKEKRPDLKIEGPIQYDAAVDLSVGKSKMPDSEVAGQASVLIFPDLNTGNNTYKAVQRETGALAIGPMLQGLNKPVNDLSRGCTVDDIINTVVITAIQAQGM